MRWVVGGLLVAAAVLKAGQLVAEPVLALVGPLASWFLLVQIGVELGFGLVVLSGIYWRQLRWIAILLFAGFAAYSSTLALNGVASCGCFGPLKIHPWWTFSLDLAIVAGLLFSIRRWRKDDDAVEHAESPSLFRQRAISATILGVSGLCVALSVRYADKRTASADDPISACGLIILEPEKWVGGPLPIADWIDLDLSAGDWIVLFHRHDCPACREVVPQFEELALKSTAEQVAIVEVPPYDERMRHYYETHARLSDQRDWFVQTPVELRLSDGVVTSATSEFPQLASQ